MRLFGPSHLVWLSGIAGIAAVLSLASRRAWLDQRVTRVVMACLLAGAEIARLPSSHLHFPGRLPLELCNVSTWTCVLACLTLTPLAVEFVYFVGLASASVALLTPDMGSSWPAQFFFNHGGIVICASALVYGRMTRLRSGAVWRAFGLLALYGGAAGLFDWIYGTNYAYLRTKPRGVTLLAVMGPWPVYIFSAAVVALGLFWLLWLPVRPAAVKETRAEPREVPEDAPAAAS